MAGDVDEGSEHGLDRAFSQAALQDPEAVAALDEWRQGDLVCDVPLFWATTSGHDTILRLEVEDQGTGHLPVVTSPHLSSKAFGAISSQTCEIGTGGPGYRYPSVQVCPLILLTGRYSGDYINQVVLGKKGDLVHVTSPPEAGDWAVDLRISLPVSKAALLAQTRRSCFASEAEALEFGERVGTRYVRPALHDAITDELVGGLRKLVDGVRGPDPWTEKVEQFRLEVCAGDRLAPTRIQIWVVTTEKLDGTDREALVAWKRQEKKRLKKAAGIELNPLRWIPIDDMKATQYRNSSPLHVPELGSGTFFL